MRWEYMTLRWRPIDVFRSFDEKLNHLGAEGWELVAVVPLSFNSGRLYHLKRPY